jgi:penicillin-binding protein 1A
MAYAHQGIELKPIPGLAAPSPGRANVAANASNSNTKSDVPQRPSLLTKRAADILVHVEQLMDDAAHALAARASADQRVENDGTAAPAGRPDSLAAASERVSGSRGR